MLPIVDCSYIVGCCSLFHKRQEIRRVIHCLDNFSIYSGCRELAAKQ